MPDERVFYSWQSDLPNKTNRGLIEKALQQAVDAIRDDGAIEVEPVVDRDTAGVAGSPDIASTILNKIDAAAAFVCDVTQVNANQDARATPNPNVLVELGYAMKSLGSSRIVQVLNVAFGPVEALPFDLRQRRTLTYESHPGDEARAPARKILKAQLEDALRAILQDPPTTVDALADAEHAIRKRSRDRSLVVADAAAALVSRLKGLAPGAGSGEPDDQRLVTALDATVHVVADYARLCMLAVRQRDTESLAALFQGLEGVAQQFDPPHGFEGGWSRVTAQYYRFLGREMALVLVAAIVKGGRLDLLAPLFEQELFVDNIRGGHTSFVHLSQALPLFGDRKKRLAANRLSLIADYLRDRHKKAPLGETLAVQDLAEADLLLFWRYARIQGGLGHRFPWFPTVGLFCKARIRALDSAVRKRGVPHLAAALGVAADDIREQLAARKGLLREVYHTGWPDDPLEDFDLSRIGTRD